MSTRKRSPKKAASNGSVARPVDGPVALPKPKITPSQSSPTPSEPSSANLPVALPKPKMTPSQSRPTPSEPSSAHVPVAINISAERNHRRQILDDMEKNDQLYNLQKYLSRKMNNDPNAFLYTKDYISQQFRDITSTNGSPKELVIDLDNIMGTTGLRTLEPPNNKNIFLRRKFTSDQPRFIFKTNQSSNNKSKKKPRKRQHENDNGNNQNNGNENNGSTEIPERINVGFLSHGTSIGNYFIVPENFSVSVYTKCGKPLTTLDFFKSYYLRKSNYKHTYEAGSVINDIQMSLNPYMESQADGCLNTTNYVGILPMPYGYYRPDEIPDELLTKCIEFEQSFERELSGLPEEFRNIVLTKYGSIYKFPKFYNVPITDPEYCNILHIYNYNIIIEALELVDDEFNSKISKSFCRKFASYEQLLEIYSLKYKKIFHSSNNDSTDTKLTTKLFRLISKKEQNIKRLSGFFGMNKGKFSKFFLSELLKAIKPGDYSFFMCRSFIGNTPVSDSTLNFSRPRLSRHLSTNNLTKSTTMKASNSTDACSIKNEEILRLKTSPLFKHFGGNNGKIAVLARFIEHILIPLLMELENDEFKTLNINELLNILVDETLRPLKNYLDTFIQNVMLSGKDYKSYQEAKIYSPFLNINYDGAGVLPKITYNNVNIFSIKSSDVEKINLLNLLIYHLLLRLRLNFLVLNIPTKDLGDFKDKRIKISVLFSRLFSIDNLNARLFVDGMTLDEYFEMIDISSKYYNLIYVTDIKKITSLAEAAAGPDAAVVAAAGSDVAVEASINS